MPNSHSPVSLHKLKLTQLTSIFFAKNSSQRTQVLIKNTVNRAVKSRPLWVAGEAWLVVHDDSAGSVSSGNEIPAYPYFSGP